MLDKQRADEINVLDLMQNTSIIYHLESVIEMQFLCLLSAMYTMNEDSAGATRFIVISLLAHHVFAYISSLYRKWEIEHHGKPDINGIMRGKVESMLSTVEMFIICVLSGYTLNYLFAFTYEEFHAIPIIHYWVIVDCLLMFISMGY